jgi:hypothetical protein
VAEGVMLIGLLPGHTEAYERYNGRACVRQVIESIRHNGDSSAEKPRYKFNSKKNHVENNAHRAAKRTVRGAYLRRRNIAAANKNFCKKIYQSSPPCYIVLNIYDIITRTKNQVRFFVF